MKKNIAWFSIVIAMWIVLLITLLAFLILEYIIPFGRNVKGIEHTSKAYYQAQSGIEWALYDIAIQNTGYSTGTSNVWVISYNYQIIWEWNLLPPLWQWNSEYDNDWNIIAPNNAIQLEIWAWIIDWSEAYFHFRIPDIGSNEILQWWTWAIINWQISSETDLLTATGSWVSADIINDYNDGDDGLQMDSLLWATLENGDIRITDFYDSNIDFAINDTSDCSSSNTQCTLKFSIVNPLVLEPAWGFNSGIQLPYLEWKMEFWTNDVPLRYANLESEWKSYGFEKKLNVKIPQQTIVEAFDFTVFQ